MKRRLLPALFAIALLPSVIAQQTNIEPTPDPGSASQTSSSTDTAAYADSTSNPGVYPNPEMPTCQKCNKETGEMEGVEPLSSTSCPPGAEMTALNNSVNITIGIGTSYYVEDDYIKRDRSKPTLHYKGYNPPTRGAYPEMPTVMGHSSKSVTVRPVSLNLRTKTINAAAFSPASLQLFGAGQGTIVKKVGGVLRQIRTDQYLTDIIETAQGYDVKIYDAATVSGTTSPIHNHGPNMTPAPTGDVLYTPGANSRLLQHLKIYPQNNGEFALEHINYTSSLTSPRERIYVWKMTGTYPNHTSTLNYYGRANNVTTLFATNKIESSDLGDGLIQRLRTIQKITNDQTLVTTSVTRDKYRDLGGDMLRIFETTTAPGTPEEITTTYTYTNSDGLTRVNKDNEVRPIIMPHGTSRDHTGMPIVNPPAKKSPDLYLGGRMTSMQRSDGYWETYTYAFNNATQSMNMEVRSSWKNEPFDSANARVRAYYIEKNSARLVEKIAGTIVSDVTETIRIDAASGMRIARKVTRTGADTPPISEEAGFYPWTAGVTYGRLAYNRHSDGTLSRYTYTTDAATNALIVTEEHGVINPAQSAPEASGPLVGNFTAGTRKVTTRNLSNIDSSEKTYDIASNLLLSQWDALTFDDVGRPTKIIHNLDPTDYEETTYNCCGIATRRERDGTTTQFTRDFLGRETFTTSVIGSRTINNATTYSSENLNGRTLPKVTRTRSVTAAGNTMSQFLGETISTLAGQTIISRSADANGDGQPEETTYTQNIATRSTSVTGPDGTISTSTRYADGQQHTSVTEAAGTAITPLATYDYTLHNLNGGGIKTTVTQSADNVVLKSSSFYADQAGRTIKTESPGYNGAILTSAPLYDERGRNIGATRTGQPAKKYVLNLQGEITEVWTDANGDGEFNDTVVADIKDTCQKTTTDYVTEDGKVCQRTTQSLRTDANADVITATSYTSTDGLYRKSVPLASTGPITVTTAIRPNVAEASSLLAQSTTKTYLTATTFLESTSTTTLNANGTATTTQTNKDTTGATIFTASSTTDLLDRTVTQVGERGLTTSYGNFTEAGQPLLTTHSDDTQTRITLDAAARPTKVETLDANGTVKATRHTSYHPTGQAAAQWGDLTNPTYNIYSTQGQLVEIRTYKNQTAEPTTSTAGYEKTNWDYEPATGLLLNKRYADNKGTDYTYTPDGKLLTKTSAREVSAGTRLKATYDYNSAGRLTDITYNDGSTPNVSLNYNRLGKKTTVSNGVATTDYTYTAATLALDTETITYDIDTNGTPELVRTLDRRDPSLGRDKGWELKNGTTIENEVTLDYSPTNGRLATLSGGAFQAPSPSTFHYNYIPNSSLVHTVTGPAHTVTNDYDPDRNVLLTKSNTKASDNTVISSVNYIVNTLGQRTKRTTSDAATSVVTDWTYDALGQVETEDQPGTTTDRAYQYDHIGNRKKSSNSLNLPEDDNYTSNALNQYTAFTSGQLTSEPQYDFDGNMTHGPHPADPTIPALFFYDAENRLLEIRNATTGVTLQSNHYDAFHRLIRVTALHNGQSTTEHILWKGWTLVSRLVSSGGSLSETFHYTWGKDLSGSEQGAGGVGGLLAITRVPVTGDASTRYPLYDGNGNITALVTADGSLSATYRYDAFGNTLSPTDHDGSGWVNHNIHGFSTKPTFGHQGLHYYGYRWYNAPQGRWLNRDPIEERGGLNLYGFVGNKAVISWDVLGLDGPTLPVVNELVNYIAGTASEPGRLGDFLSSGSSRNFVDRPTTDLSNHPGVRSAIAVEQLRASAKRLAIQACCKKPGSMAAPIEVPNLGLAAVDSFVYPLYFASSALTNPVDTFLGSISKSETKIMFLDCCKKVATVEFKLYNEAGFESNVRRPPTASGGYGDSFGSNNPFGKGSPLNTVSQKAEWDETFQIDCDDPIQNGTIQQQITQESLVRVLNTGDTMQSQFAEWLVGLFMGN